MPHRPLLLVFLVLLILLVLCVLSSHATDECGGVPCVDDVPDVVPSCKGRFCAHRVGEEGTILPDCGACPWGSRARNSVCVECRSPPSTYDILYLTFMLLFLLIVHLVSVGIAVKKARDIVWLSASCLVEVLLSALLALLSSQPRGTLKLWSCGVDSIADWYTTSYNPRDNYCAHEAVFPLWTSMMIFYALAAGFVIGIRLPVAHFVCGDRGSRSVYWALLYLPLLVFLQVPLGGVIYYGFPYAVFSTCILADLAKLTLYANNLKQLFRRRAEQVGFAGRYVTSGLALAAALVFHNVMEDARYLPVVFFGPLAPSVLFVLTKRITKTSLWS